MKIAILNEKTNPSFVTMKKLCNRLRLTLKRYKVEVVPITNVMECLDFDFVIHVTNSPQCFTDLNLVYNDKRDSGLLEQDILEDIGKYLYDKLPNVRLRQSRATSMNRVNVDCLIFEFPPYPSDKLKAILDNYESIGNLLGMIIADNLNLELNKSKLNTLIKG